MVTGPFAHAVLNFASGLILRYSKSYDAENPRLVYDVNGEREFFVAESDELAVTAEAI